MTCAMCVRAAKKEQLRIMEQWNDECSRVNRRNWAHTQRMSEKKYGAKIEICSHSKIRKTHRQREIRVLKRKERQIKRVEKQRHRKYCRSVFFSFKTWRWVNEFIICNNARQLSLLRARLLTAKWKRLFIWIPYEHTERTQVRECWSLSVITFNYISKPQKITKNNLNKWRGHSRIVMISLR